MPQTLQVVQNPQRNLSLSQFLTLFDKILHFIKVYRKFPWLSNLLGTLLQSSVHAIRKHVVKGNTRPNGTTRNL
eukprot:CCRYP_013880-RA/>CCRYP_013880-RA protein AED:0.42 eAED:0.42 QI:0/1/1/1/0/0/2/140/73